ncbi:MAG: type IV secretion protein Dot [Legionellales bacterium]
MSFAPPAFLTLRAHTLNLDTEFSTLLKRYKVIANPIDSAAAGVLPQSSLEVLLQRTSNFIVSCKTKRESARDVFKQLIIELKQIPKEDEKKIKQGAMFLLGALLHRYFRILQAYDGPENLFWSTSNPLDCRLLQAIREVLQLESKSLAAFREQDLATLDVQTIVSTLEVFRDTMLIEHAVNNKPHYMNYPHFANDKNFKPYLQQMIDKHALDKKNLPVLGQFKAIYFIQSLVKQIDSQQTELQDTLRDWQLYLSKQYPDFKRLDSEIIKAHIHSHIQPAALRDKIISIIDAPYIQENLATHTHETFAVAMGHCHVNTAKYVVFGGYALLLQSDKINSEMKSCIHQLLGIKQEPKVLTEKDQHDGIIFLKKFIEQNPDVILDYQFFGHKQQLNTQIAQIELSLVNRMQERTRQEASAASAVSSGP